MSGLDIVQKNLENLEFLDLDIVQKNLENIEFLEFHIVQKILENLEFLEFLSPDIVQKNLEFPFCVEIFWCVCVCVSGSASYVVSRRNGDVRMSFFWYKKLCTKHW